jgi:hypothetical protein
MFDALIGEIRHLEGQVPGHRAIRAELGIPSLDGAPESWLVRYCGRFREAVAPVAVEPEERQPKPRRAASTRAARQQRQAGVAACGGAHPTVAGVTCDKAVGYPGSHGNDDRHLFWLTPEQLHPNVDRIPPSVDDDTDADPDDPFGELVETTPTPTPTSPFAAMDQAWAEMSAGKAVHAYNVWTGRGRSGRCVWRGDSLRKATAAAWEHRPARVFEGFVELKKHRTKNSSQLDRLQQLASKLAKLRRPTELVEVASAKVGPKKVGELIDAMRVGKLMWQGSYPAEVPKADLVLAKVNKVWTVSPAEVSP